MSTTVMIHRVTSLNIEQTAEKRADGAPYQATTIAGRGEDGALNSVTFFSDLPITITFSPEVA